MPLIRVRKAGQVTLPLAMCRALDLKQYDYLDATVAEGSIVLKPVAVFARAGMGRQADKRRPTAQQGREPTIAGRLEIRVGKKHNQKSGSHGS